MSKNERTSASVASKASTVMRDPNASPEAKSVAASALSQAPDRGTDGPSQRLSPEGPSSETIMTKDTKDSDKTADQSREIEKETVNPADAPANQQGQDQGVEARGPGQSSGEPMQEIDKTDLRGDSKEFLDAKENEDMALTDHDPATDPEPVVNKLETDQLHQADDGRIRTGDNKVAWAPPGSYDAAKNGVQQDASGSFTSANLPGGARVS